MQFFGGRTLFELVDERAARENSRTLYTWGESSEDQLTYAQLASASKAAARYIGRLCEPGAPVLLLLPTGRDFVASLFGCIFARALAVPLPPPRGRRGLQRIRAVARDCGARLAIVPPGTGPLPELAELGLELHSLPRALYSEPDHQGGRFPSASPDAPALLQYTSGSTRSPKGVLVTQHNILSNCEIVREVFGHRREDRGLIWLPPHHDMGLLGGIFQPLYAEMTVHLLSSLEVTQRPRAWLEAISAVGATVSGGPDAMYRACVERRQPEAQPPLDLSSWRVAFSGAEPVRPRTLARFAEAFASVGFDRRAFLPCYGLAEATLLVAGTPHDHEARVDERVDGVASVASGPPASNHEVLIVDPKSAAPVLEGEEGEIWVRGPSVAAGYFDAPAATAARFGAHLEDGRGPFLRTGDIGALRGGALFVYGRLDDMIVVRGRNLHPSDLEQAAHESHPSIRAVAACGFEREDHQGVLVVAECASRDPQTLDAVAQAIRGAVVAESGVAPDALVLVRSGTLPRTTSGKVQRFEVRLRFERGALHPLRAPELDVHALRAATQGASGSALDAVLAWVASRNGGVVPDPDVPLVASGLDSLDLAALAQTWPSDLGPGPGLAELLRAEATPRRLAGATRPGIGSASSGHRDARVVTGPRAAAILDARRALWAFDRAHRGHPGLVLSRRFSLHGLSGPEVLQTALQMLLARHPELTFARPAPGVTTVVAAPQDIIRRLDTPSASPPRFDITSQAGFLAEICPQADDRLLLTVHAHHLAVDLGCFSTLFSDLLGLLSGAPHAEVSPLQIQPDADRHPQESAQAYLSKTFVEPMPCPSAPAPDGAKVVRHFCRIDAQTTQRVASVARATETTPFVVAASVWSVLARGVLGPGGDVVGCPVSLRPPGVDAVGYFVNLLPVRFAASPSLRWSALFEAHAERWRDAARFREVVFARRPEQVGEGTASTLPPSVVVFERTDMDTATAEVALGVPGARVEFAGLAIESLDVRPAGVQVPLALTVLSTRDGWVVTLEVDATRVDAAASATLLDRYARLLELATAEAAGLVGGAPLLTESERLRLVRDFSRGPDAQPAHRMIAPWWREVVRAHEDAIAVRGPAGALAYGALDAAARTVAQRLVADGLAPEEVVAFVAHRRPETIAAMLGVVLAGGTFLALDPAHPTRRHEAFLAQLGVQRAVGVDGAPSVGTCKMTCVPDLGAIESSADLDLPMVAPEGAAYVVFTSGSTGQPKPVVCTQQGLCHLVHAQARAFGARPGARTLQFASFAFDASVSEVFVSLLTGGELILQRDGSPRLGDHLEADLDGVDIATLPPAVLRRLDPSRLPGLGTVVSAGEACSDEIVRRWSQGRRFVNAYGPTEATVCASMHVCNPDGVGTCIGRPLPGGRVYVLDDALEPVPVGVVGELFVGGPQVARGYLGDPRLTAERFLPDRFGPPGARMYRTGDRVRWDASANLHFVGRIDRMVKVRGVRVELAEVERHLSALDAVAECVVGVRVLDDEPRLVAWWTPADGPSGPSHAVLRTALRRMLPEAMIPSMFVRVVSIPRGVNGKVDASALRLPERVVATVAATGSLEDKIAAVWCETIPASSVGRDEGFFDVGGTSLTAVDVHNRLQEMLGRRFPLETLYAYPTVRSLTEHLQGTADDALPSERLRVAADRGREGRARLQRARKRGRD